MNKDTFEELLNRVSTCIERQDTNLRASIPAKERLVATLQFIASGRSYNNLKFRCAIFSQALGIIIPETCAVIFDVLKKEFLTVQENLK